LVDDAHHHREKQPATMAVVWLALLAFSTGSLYIIIIVRTRTAIQ